MKNQDVKNEKQTISKVVTVRLLGIKILQVITEMPLSENKCSTCGLLYSRNGTNEVSL